MALRPASVDRLVASKRCRGQGNSSVVEWKTLVSARALPSIIKGGCILGKT